MRKLLVASAALFALAVGGSASAATNLVFNGDFELGDVGFASDYTYAVPTYNQAEYSTPGSPCLVHGSFSCFSDHTPDPGNLMMVVNGSDDPNEWVWKQDVVNVEQNTTYYFSTWIASVYPVEPAKLRFFINDDPLGAVFTASATTGVWQQFYATWNSGSNTTATIGLKNQNTAYSGNDFALDDIVLSTAAVPEPATWALMIAGFGGAGAMLRRRRSVAA
jgi:hypothetical protein